jgi:pimeloyl-ACP methyl ester carboxylesterase
VAEQRERGQAPATVERRAAVRAAMHRLLASEGAEARSIMTTVDGAALHHLEAGAGPPVVLLHGGSGGGANWFRVLPQLSQRSRVLAPDLPGFGLSDGVVPRAPLGRTAAQTLLRWLDAVEVERAVVAGTSFGGLAALRLAQLAPTRVAGLFLLSSAGLGRELPPLVRLATVPGLATLGLHPTRRGGASVFRSLLTSDRSTLSAEQVAALLEYLHLSARQAGTRYLVRTLRMFASARGQREVLTAAEFAALPMPVSIAWGALDPFLPPEHGRVCAPHCRAELTIIPDAGHSPNWERPAAVVHALQALIRRAHGVQAPPPSTMIRRHH